MRKKIKKTVHLSGYVFWVLVVVLGLYLLLAKPELEAQLLVEQQGKIVAPVGEPIDVFYVIKNTGLDVAHVENVFIYDVDTKEPLRLSRSYPKHAFNIWPGDEKLIRMEVVQPDGKNEVRVALNVAYRDSDDVAPTSPVTLAWE
ncbi:hypothetical protein D6774_04995 [Candidatus Woesearchaeota archaeon]|nr:MAG: hypothetical protein D6774_04995 [Candidatus Woesearchaeota archaeon]